ncbi:MAG: YicC family protein [Methylophaga sp.]|nr:YicC/YloC family endoribonuclease [Methylophaga sp. UBA678]MAX52404.1 YicC family protein [Methylophaga sp.]|tara:strand:- start:167401 stop:168255 length:855 start_codon:yes stop_codon:yes gene_type:complete
MTAFARHEEQTELGSLSWEIRSVNHRYLEVSFRLEESFRPFEMAMRKLISDTLSRGKVEVALRYRAPEQTQSALQTNVDLAKAVMENYQQLASFTDSAAPIDILRVMQWPGVIQTESLDQDALQATVLESLKHALADLVATREREGAALEQMIIQRCEQINDIAEQTKTRLPEIVASHRQKLSDRIAELEVNLEPERLEQEMVLLAQKADVAEEIDRLQNHVNEVKHTLKRDEPIGRRLDFLMQELNREANTLGSKSIDTDTTRYSVDLKVLIEQMREQIQNIE